MNSATLHITAGRRQAHHPPVEAEQVGVGGPDQREQEGRGASPGESRLAAREAAANAGMDLATYYRTDDAQLVPRVAITGIGVVSPFGVGRDRFWRHVSRGCSATRAITDFDASPFPCTVAAPVPPVSIDEARWRSTRTRHGRAASAAGRPDPRRYSKASLIAVIAATEAWQRRRAATG